MEKWLRKVLESVGGKLDARTRSGEAGLREISLKLSPQVQRALEQNTRSEGSRHFAPHVIRIALPYELYHSLTEDAREVLSHQILETAENFVRDRRYAVQKSVSVQIVSDVFRDHPAVRVDFEAKDLPPSQMIKEKTLRILDVQGTELLRTPLRGGNPIRLGRAQGNTLVLDDGSVSKFHAIITLDAPGNLIVQDLGSTNGTFVGDSAEPLEGSSKISPTQQIRLGDVVLRLVFD